MADNYLERQYENYEARKAAWQMKKKLGLATKHHHSENSTSQIQSTKDSQEIAGNLVPQKEETELLSEIVSCLKVPYELKNLHLYNAKSLYEGYQVGRPITFKDCYDSKVYRHYIQTGKATTDFNETLARTLHDHSISNALHDFLSHYNETRVVGIMGGHGLLRTDDNYHKIALLSKMLTEKGCLMTSGGGPGAMEATHLGAWMAGRSNKEFIDAIEILKPYPSYQTEGWLDSTFQVMKKYPQEKYQSLGVPTWLYGHEPSTPLATHIAKYFENALREDGILTIAKGGIIYAPGSAGTLQEVFQEAVQNHYLSFGYASPMVFLGTQYWEKEMPIYTLLKFLLDKGLYKHLLLTISDQPKEIEQTILQFIENKEQK